MATTTDEATTTTDGRPPAAASYLTAVEEALADIDAEERQDLIEDLRAHIDELLEEEGEDLDLQARLGAPASYAAELVESAGLGRVDRQRLHRRLAARVTSLRQHPRMAVTLTWLQQLRPAWWVARGYGLALLLGMLTSGLPVNRMLPVPPVLSSWLVGLVTTLALIWLSVEVGAGRIHGRGRRPVTIVLSIIAALTLWVVALDARSYGGGHVPAGEEAYLYEELDLLSSQLEVGRLALTLPGGEPVTNIYAFDAEGNRLEDVLLYDGVGNPLVLQDVIDGDGFPFGHFGLQTDYRRDADGRLVPNLYPLTQYRVSVPDDMAHLDMAEEEFSDGAATMDNSGPAPRDPDIGPRTVPEVAIPPLEASQADDARTARPDSSATSSPRVPE